MPLIDEIRAVNLDLGSPTPEASLDTIVYRYYRAHFDHDQSRTFVNEYFEALEKHLNLNQWTRIGDKT